MPGGLGAWEKPERETWETADGHVYTSSGANPVAAMTEWLKANSTPGNCSPYFSFGAHRKTIASICAFVWFRRSTLPLPLASQELVAIFRTPKISNAACEPWGTTGGRCASICPAGSLGGGGPVGTTLAVPLVVNSAAVTAGESRRLLKRLRISICRSYIRGVTVWWAEESTLTSILGPKGSGIEMISVLGDPDSCEDTVECLALIPTQQ